MTLHISGWLTRVLRYLFITVEDILHELVGWSISFWTSDELSNKYNHACGLDADCRGFIFRSIILFTADLQSPDTAPTTGRCSQEAFMTEIIPLSNSQHSLTIILKLIRLHIYVIKMNFIAKLWFTEFFTIFLPNWTHHLSLLEVQTQPRLLQNPFRKLILCRKWKGGLIHEIRW